MKKYEKCANGEVTKKIKSVDDLMEVCQSIHQVTPADLIGMEAPECDYNPKKLICIGCKGFCQRGICSHVVAVNHLLLAVNLRQDLQPIGLSNALVANRAGGNKSAPLPALQKTMYRNTAADEEQRKLIEAGARGE